MSAGERLEQYLTDIRQRLRAVVVARASAAVALTALLVTVAAILVLRDPGFPTNAVMFARVALVIALIATAAATLWRPLVALSPSKRARTFERHLPAQGGRVETYLELARRREQGQPAPLIDLLAEDALAVADTTPASEAIPSKRALIPAATGAAALFALALMLALGQSEWGFGSRNLWFGTPIPQEQIALRKISVTPGNATVRRNQDIPIHASIRGFKANNAEVYVRFGDGKAWERAPMSPAADGGFEFTVYALREPLSYYVTSRGTKSAEHRITVAEVPRVERMRLTYSYPSWTGLSQEVDETSRDIRAVAGTKVSVEVQTSAPLDSPTLSVNKSVATLQKDGMWSRGTIELTKAGHYRISARVGEEMVPLTDEYEIALIADQQPSIEFARPGRDWQASSIEEVPVQVHARDDFRVENIELHYSVNGGDWQVTPFKGRGKDVNGDTILRLEEMGDAQALPEASSAPRLTPGDLVTYYAVAKDRKQAVQTDLFLIHVQPFERRFTQGQAAGSQGGGAGDEQQNAISQRQREILLATWNLQRSRERADGRGAERLDENAHMLSEAQGTLAEQARTLIERAQARGVDNADPKNRALIENLQQAAEAMQPAAKHLSEIQLPQAIPQEQKALQHLLRAEALYTDIEIQFQNANAGGGNGAQAGRDLAEMFELEMDLDKNQYETESRAAGDESPQQLADAMRKLRELAQRQEQLARETARQQQAPRESERWKQEQLKRETEDLRKQLAELARQDAQSNSEQGQSQQNQSGQGDSRQARSQRGQSSQGQASQGESSAGQSSEGEAADASSGGQSSSTASTAAQALNQVERALENMRNAESQGRSGQSPDTPANARAAQQASRDLRQALEKIEQGRREGMAGTFDDLAERARRLAEEQRRGEQELLSAFSRPGASSSGTPSEPGAPSARPRGLSWERAEALAEQKRSLQNELETLQRDMDTSSRQHREDAPDAAGRVGGASKELAESGVSAGLARSAMELERGRGLQAAARDGMLTQALEALEANLGQAAQVAANEARQKRTEKNEATPEELLAELSELRRAWQAARDNKGARGPGDSTAPGDSDRTRTASTQSRPGSTPNGATSPSGGRDGASPGNNTGNDQPGSPSANGADSPGSANSFNGGGSPNLGGYARHFIEGDRGRLNAWNPPLAANATRPTESAEFQKQAAEIGRRLRDVLNRTPENSLPPADISALRQLAAQLRRSGGDPMEAEYGRMLGLVNQLELAALNASEKNRVSASTRAANPTIDTPEYRETVAEYYRRLGGTK